MTKNNGTSYLISSGLIGGATGFMLGCIFIKYMFAEKPKAKFVKKLILSIKNKSLVSM